MDVKFYQFSSFDCGLLSALSFGDCVEGFISFHRLGHSEHGASYSCVCIITPRSLVVSYTALCKPYTYGWFSKLGYPKY